MESSTTRGRGRIGFAPWLLALVFCVGPGCDGVVGGSGPADPGDPADVEAPLEIATEIAAEIPATPVTPEALAGAVDPTLWWEDVQFIAQPREPGSPHWQAVQDLCAERFEDLGYAVTRHEYATGINVIGIKEGLEAPDEWVVVSAHYDHHPGCPGADDNGAAVAGVLEIARVFAPIRFDRSLVLACWDQEEIGLKGSGAWATEQAEAGREIVASLVLETMAYTCDEPGCQKMPMGFEFIFPEQAEQFTSGDQSGDFIVFIADWTSADSAAALVEHSDALGLPSMHFEMSEDQMGSPILMDLFRSDHASFWFNDYPAIMITDSANFRNPNYHCPDPEHMDTVETLDAAFADKVFRATAYAAAVMAGVR
ncbi:MAG: M28 family peptidase [Pseudomonadota bacterium]